MELKFIHQASVENKKVLIRFDFNVPLTQENNQWVIADPTRIDLALPTIQYLLEKGASQLLMMSHLGRPKGQVKTDLSLEPVAKYLADRLNTEVILTETAIDSGIKTLVELKKSKIILLENLRFHPEEQNNDIDFAKSLAQWADLYVNDAFGVCHRKDASVHAINQFFPRTAYGGLLLEKEIKSLERVLKKPEKPLVALIGGAKVSDKITTLERLLPNVSSLLIGGAMAYPFLKAKGIKVGKSLCQDEDVALAQKLLKEDRGNKIILPLDHICADSPQSNAQKCSQDIPDSLAGFDIGEKTIAHYKEILQKAKTVFWNGPMGYFESEQFATGTHAMAAILAELKKTFTVVGGGDSVRAVHQSGFSNEIDHISTGGGASLKFIESGELVAINALKFGVQL